MRVEKIGDELVVRLPAEFVEARQVREGDEVLVTPAVSRAPAKSKEEIRAALARIRAMGPLIPADFKFDREEANERR